MIFVVTIMAADGNAEVGAREEEKSVNDISKSDSTDVASADGGVSPEMSTSVPGFLFWCWITKLINRGYKKPLQVRSELHIQTVCRTGNCGLTFCTSKSLLSTSPLAA